MEGLCSPSLVLDVPADRSLGQFGEEWNRLRAEVSCLRGENQELRRENQELRQQLGQLQTEVTGLQRANLELRQEAGYWQSRHRAAVGRISQFEGTIQQLATEKRQLQSQFQEQIERLEAEKRQLKADLFGRQTEKHSHDGYGELVDPLEQRPPRPRGQQAGQPRPPRRDYSHLETRTELNELPSTQRVCGHCGKALAVLQGTEDSEVVEVEVSAYRRLVQRRRYRRTCTCPGQRTFTAVGAENPNRCSDGQKSRAQARRFGSSGRWHSSDARANGSENESYFGSARAVCAKMTESPRPSIAFTPRAGTGDASHRPGASP